MWDAGVGSRGGDTETLSPIILKPSMRRKFGDMFDVIVAVFVQISIALSVVSVIIGKEKGEAHLEDVKRSSWSKRYGRRDGMLSEDADSRFPSIFFNCCVSSFALFYMYVRTLCAGT